jgi:hypothetical protein
VIKYQLRSKSIYVGIILVNLSTCGIVFQSAEAALLGLPFEELSRQAELIILGVVLDEKLAEPGTVGAGLENHTISVEKLIKGTYNGSTVSVITESQIMEDSPKFKHGERTILFLYQKPLFGDKPSGNDYTVVNQLNGKYDVDDNGKTIADFEKKITVALSSPRTNNTRSSSDANYYRNDTDLIFSNDTDTSELVQYQNFTS